MNEASPTENPLGKAFTVHLISDATGTTLQALAHAALAQFDGIAPEERFWPLVRTEKQLDRVIHHIAEAPGPVLFTLVDPNLRGKLQDECAALGVPAMAVLDPVIKGLSSYLGLPSKGVPGLQYALDKAYFSRIDAMDFTLTYDDGQALDGIERADVILVGVSRTSKTPTCIYLARRGIKAANFPLCPGVPVPEKLLELDGPLIVGLTEAPDRLAQLRRARLQNEKTGAVDEDNGYLDPLQVENEIREARRFFSKQGWPVIDVTRRSIEETAAEIMFLLQKKKTAREENSDD